MTTPKDALYARTYTCFYDGTAFPVALLYVSARDKYQRLDEYFDIPVYQPPPGGGDPAFAEPPPRG